MGRVESPALRGTWLGRLLKLLAPVMRGVLGSPLHPVLSRWFLLLAWSGPKTGARHVIPLSYLEDGGATWVTTGDKWWRSVVGANDVGVRVRGRLTPARVAAISDVEESTRTHIELFRRHAWFRVLAGIPRASSGEPDEAAVRRSVTAGRTLVRIDRDGGAPRSDDRSAPV